MKFFLWLLLFVSQGFWVFAQKGSTSYTKYYYKNFVGELTDKIESEGNVMYIPAQKGRSAFSHKVGLWKFYHPSGTLKTQIEYNKDGLETGSAIFYTETGLRAEEGEFKLGKQTGVWKSYYDGILKSETEYENDLKNGDYFEYSVETGNKIVCGTFLNDAKAGKWTLYNKNGIQDGEVNYNQAGQKNGYWKATSFMNSEVTSGNYKDDERIGIWTVQNKEGKIIQTVDFNQGISINYYHSGKLLSELAFFKAPNDRIGLRRFVLLHENGSKRLEGDFDERLTYRPDVFDQFVLPKGKWNSYWEDGELATVYNFDKGNYDVVKTKLEEKYYYSNNKGAYGKGEKALKELNFYSDNDSIKIAMKDFIALDPKSNLFLTYVGPKLSLGSFTRTGFWENYDSLGNLETKVNYDEASNKVVGSYTSFYKNGKVKSKGEYDNAGKRVGSWTFYYENGNKAEESIYDVGKRTGLVVEYFTNGSPKHKGAYVEDKRVGIHEYFHPNGKVLGSENYKNGSLVNFGDFYSEEGLITMQQGTGSLVKYYDNTNKLEFANYVNGKLDGNYASYFENGNTKWEAKYQSGVLQGDYQSYFEAGGIMEKGTYVNGKVESILSQYHPNGTILGKSQYRNGVLVRPEAFYDDKGNSIMSNGTGIFLIYNNKGIVTAKFNYLDYCRNGKAQWYYDNGQLLQEAIYKYSDANKPTGLRWEILSSFSSDGKSRDPGTLKNGNGTWITYDDTGKKTVTIYQNGLPKQ